MPPPAPTPGWNSSETAVEWRPHPPDSGVQRPHGAKSPPGSNEAPRPWPLRLPGAGLRRWKHLLPLRRLHAPANWRSKRAPGRGPALHFAKRRPHRECSRRQPLGAPWFLRWRFPIQPGATDGPRIGGSEVERHSPRPPAYRRLVAERPARSGEAPAGRSPSPPGPRSRYGFRMPWQTRRVRSKPALAADSRRRTEFPSRQHSVLSTDGWNLRMHGPHRWRECWLALRNRSPGSPVPAAGSRGSQKALPSIRLAPRAWGLPAPLGSGPPEPQPISVSGFRPRRLAPRAEMQKIAWFWQGQDWLGPPSPRLARSLAHGYGYALPWARPAEAAEPWLPEPGIEPFPPAQEQTGSPEAPGCWRRQRSRPGPRQSFQVRSPRPAWP